MSASTLVNAAQIHVRLSDRSYVIDIGAGVLKHGLPMALLSGTTQIALVSNSVVYPLYGAQFEESLRASGLPVVSVVLPDGEEHKDWQTLNQIFDALLSKRCDRKTLLVALGGGVVGDMVGFAAATYQRGVPFVQVPTTLLAQVDSSVGGKTAINHALGKNMIGAFYQPQYVLIDTDVLRTLPDRQYRAGLAEVIKYGIALDAAFFVWLEQNMRQLRARDERALRYAIRRSCEIKASVVADDELELKRDGGRALLNFGHTFGHAIETALGYGVWLHGEAVGCGMALATTLSHRAGRISDNNVQRILRLIQDAGLETSLPQTDKITPSVLLDHMSRDKKNEGGTIKLILLNQLGGSIVDTSFTQEAILRFLQR
jgi:3-dehydroquinate synthase